MEDIRANLELIDKLTDDRRLRRWLNTVKDKENTIRSYNAGIKRFLKFAEMTPEELLKEAKKELKDPDLDTMDYRHVERVEDYLNQLVKEGAAQTTMKGRLNAVKSFYASADIMLPRRIRIKNAEPKKENQQTITKDDIRDILNIADPFERAMVLVGCSSGLAEADIIELKISDFKNGYDASTGVTTLTLKRVKTGVDFVTFLTPEASEAVNIYLEYRNRKPKQAVYSEDGYLFIERYIPVEFMQTKDEELRKFKDRAFTWMYGQIAEKCGKVNKNAYNLVRSHNMRKFFVTTLRNEGFDFAFVDGMAGHKEDSVDRAYYTYRDIEKLKEQYIKCIPYLTIENNLDITENPVYKKLIEENEVLRLQNTRLDELSKEYKEVVNLTEASNTEILEKQAVLLKKIEEFEKKTKLVDWLYTQLSEKGQLPE